MARLSCAEIRDRVVEIVLQSPSGVQRGQIMRLISEESPETKLGTISVQINEAAAKNPHLIDRSSGRYRPWRSSDHVESSFAAAKCADTVDLMELGFVRTGHFCYDGPCIQRALLHHGERCPALYAFVIGEEIVYVGKSAIPLEKRLAAYAKPGQTQSTNIRNNAFIKEALDGGRRVDIWVLVDWEPLEHRGIPVNVAAGIEDALISRFAPSWNVRRTL